MKVLILGSGVLGCYTAYRFYQKNIDFALLSRGEKYKRFSKDGIDIKHYLHSEVKNFKPRVISDPEGEEFDLVFIFVQAIQQESVIETLTKLKKVKAFLFLGNNGEGYDFATKVLGAERVLFGFGSVGGTWINNTLVYADSQKLDDKPFDKFVLGAPEKSAKKVLRLSKSFLKENKFKVSIFNPIRAWHLSHIALVVTLAGGFYQVNCDLKLLAANEELLNLVILSLKESIKLLNNINIPIKPFSIKIMSMLSNGKLAKKIKDILRSPFAEIALAGHANCARDEMRYLAKSLLSLDDNSNKYRNLRELLEKI